jgi:hypothetical protein
LSEKRGQLLQKSNMEWYVIYADDFIEWNKEIDDFDYNDKFYGTYSNAFEYAYKKYGKRFTINKAEDKELFKIWTTQS